MLLICIDPFPFLGNPLFCVTHSFSIIAKNVSVSVSISINTRFSCLSLTFCLNLSLSRPLSHALSLSRFLFLTASRFIFVILSSVLNSVFLVPHFQSRADEIERQRKIIKKKLLLKKEYGICVTFKGRTRSARNIFECSRKIPLSFVQYPTRYLLKLKRWYGSQCKLNSKSI